jgi:DNA-binding transcriptional ArsR family regulator
MNGESTNPSPTDSTRPPASVGVLTDPQRCAVISTLADTGDPVSVETLAKRIHTLESDRDVDPVYLGMNSLRIRLVHCHLPKLTDFGIIDYDHELKEVRKGVAFDSARETVRRLCR